MVGAGEAQTVRRDELRVHALQHRALIVERSAVQGLHARAFRERVEADVSETDILEEERPWARVLHHRVSKPPAVTSGIAMNAEVGGHLVADWVETELHPLPEVAPDEGDGAVGRVGAHPVAISLVRGEVCRLSAVCPHLGGILRWNAAERSWLTMMG